MSHCLYFYTSLEAAKWKKWYLETICVCGTHSCSHPDISVPKGFWTLPSKCSNSWERIISGRRTFHFTVDLFAVSAPEVRREREDCKAVLVQVKVEWSAPLEHEAHLLPPHLYCHHAQADGAASLENFLPGVQLTHWAALHKVGPFVIRVHHSWREVWGLDPQVLSQEVAE